MVALLWLSSTTTVGVVDTIMDGEAEDTDIMIHGAPDMGGMEIIMVDGIMVGVADGTILLSITVPGEESTDQEEAEL
jgi:hypothetical protein